MIPTRMSRRTRARASFVALATALMLMAAMPFAASASQGATVVRGTQLAPGTCGPNNDGYAMTGDLVGCWWIDTFDVASHVRPDKANYRATGTEHFEGCLGSVCGTFFTTFEFTAKTDGAWASGAPEIHGRCHHPVVGGTAGFAGVRGEISFTDVVDVDPPYFPYWGNLQLQRDGRG